MPFDQPAKLHVSVSQLKTWMLCPRRYEWRYVRGFEEEFTPLPLVFGSAFHAALAAFYTAARAGRAAPVDELIEVFEADWARRVESGPPLEGGGADDSVIDQAALMLTAFHGCEEATQLDVLEVEKPVTAVLHDPDTGEVLEEELVGAVDLVAAAEGRTIVVEHKTSARRYSADQLRFDLQPTAYALALEQEGHADVGLRYQVVTKTKSPAVQVEDVERDSGARDDFLRTAVGVLRSIDAGVSYPIRGWQCRSCAFKARCSG
jgi:CRISPR/Cas system-associated exonuclease Cas4 (RecB family)